MIVGVTGLIGSGKSTAAGALAEEGATLIDCDLIGREVVESDAVLQYRMVLAFGGSILRPDGRLDRRQVARLAFSSHENTERLNAIVHPALLAELDRRLAACRRGRRDAVVDAALLINWQYHKKMDYTILVTAYEKNRIRRLRATGLTEAEIRQRTKSQLSLSYLKKRSDFVLANNSDADTLRRRAKQLYRGLIIRERG